MKSKVWATDLGGSHVVGARSAVHVGVRPPRVWRSLVLQLRHFCQPQLLRKQSWGRSSRLFVKTLFLLWKKAKLRPVRSTTFFCSPCFGENVFFPLKNVKLRLCLGWGLDWGLGWGLDWGPLIVLRLGVCQCVGFLLLAFLKPNYFCERGALALYFGKLCLGFYQKHSKTNSFW